MSNELVSEKKGVGMRKKEIAISISMEDSRLFLHQNHNLSYIDAIAKLQRNPSCRINGNGRHFSVRRKFGQNAFNMEHGQDDPIRCPHSNV